MLIHFKNNKTYTFEELRVLTHYDEKKFKRELDVLLSQQIIKKSGVSFGLNTNYYVGEIQVKDTFAFLLQEPEDFFIPGNKINTAMDKDIVLVKKIKNTFGVIQVIKRNTEFIIGVIKKRRKKFILQPNTELTLPLEIKDKDFIGGEVLYIKITEYKEHVLFGEVVKRLGYITDPGMDVLTIVFEKGFPYEFNQDTIEEAESLDRSIDEKDRFNDTSYLVTIDGEDAKDLDDAVGLSYDGQYHVSIHIADVSHYVKEGSLIDLEALKRGTSCYLADRVIPMLPRRLSNDLCSLNEGEDKYALSVYVTLDDEANVIEHTIKETIINVSKRLSYKEVNQFLKKEIQIDEKTDEMLTHMSVLSKMLENKRKEKGALTFKSLEYGYILDDQYDIVGVEIRKQEEAEKIIESFMILANQIVSEHLTRLDLPTMYRVHEKPTLEKLDFLSEQLKEVELKISKPKHFTPKSLQTFLESLEDHPLETYIHDLFLKAMAKARYDMHNVGHFGLASEYYSHFTAPIRRYPDLFLHRLIKAFITQPSNLLKDIKHYENIGPEVAKHASDMERLSDDLSREVDKLKIAEYMSKHIGEVYKAKVSGMIKKGFFVRTDLEGIEGMVVYNTMKKFTSFDEAKMGVHLSNGKTLKIGSTVTVELIHVDVKLRQVTFNFLK